MSHHFLSGRGLIQLYSSNQVSFILFDKHLSANNIFIEMEELCGEKDDGLNFQDAKIKDLRSRIAKQKQIHKQLVANLDIELKQEQYVARYLQGGKMTGTAGGVARKKPTRK